MSKRLPHLFLGFALVAPLYAAEDSVLYVPSSGLSQFWTISKSAPPKYPRGPENRIEAACAVVGYIIEPDGRTSSERAIAAYPSGRFGEAAAKAIRKFRFEPAASNTNRKPVYTTTIFTFQFGRSDETNEKVQAALVDICSSAEEQFLGPAAGEPAEDGVPSDSPKENRDSPNGR